MMADPSAACSEPHSAALTVSLKVVGMVVQKASNEAVETVEMTVAMMAA
jgi:hypothetical protein